MTADDGDGLDALVGPFYTAESAARIFGVTPGALPDDLIETTTSDGTVLYPAFQFRGGVLDPAIAEIARILAPAAASGWTVAWWISARHAALDELSVRAWLADGRDLETVRMLAQEVADHWRW
ncbi:hypothetical protein [Demequina soli]|uniref:hypothetical protein n=1 Tax=Demequina soli TaxID=1638987 RepID=UPI00078419B9|nr:hypothetical protein [Demequina soli]